MRVDDCHKTTATVSNLTLHLRHGMLREVCRIEREPTIISRLDRFLFSPKCMLNVKPKDVNWEPLARKVGTPLSDHVGRDRRPFAKLEAQSLNRGQRCESSCLSERLLDSGWVLGGSKHQEFKHASFTCKVNVSSFHVTDFLL